MGARLGRVVRQVLKAITVVMLALTCGTTAAQSPGGSAATQAPEGPGVVIEFFRGEGCPYCALEKEFLAELVTEFPDVVVRDYEVYGNPANRQLLFEMAAKYGGEVTGVPVTFIGAYAWTGFGERTAREIREVVMLYREAAATAGTATSQGVTAPATTPTAPADSVIRLPVIGAVDLGHRSLWLATGLIALVDGFNPCSLWVMALLLGVVVNTRSRRRLLLVGITFLSVAAVVYALFIAGLFSAFALVSFAAWIRVIVAVIALAYAVVGIKDYFALKRGLSFTIDDASKPGIYRRIRGVMSTQGSAPATVLATASMALGVTVIELPCTAGMPVLWTQLVGAAVVPTATFVLLLSLYMLVFLLDELLVFLVAVATMRVARVGERETRVLKLVGGSVMLALAVVLLVRPALLESITGTLAVFGVGIGAALVTALLHRLLAPSTSPLKPV